MQTMDIIAENTETTLHAAFVFGDFDESQINSTLRNDYSPPMVTKKISIKKYLYCSTFEEAFCP